jgi:hypothetical protein
MKKQINISIKAHLLRSAFYLLLLLAVCVIPFALGQRNTGQIAVRPTLPGAPAKSQSQFLLHHVRPGLPALIEGTACQYNFTPDTCTFVPGDTDIGSHCDDCDTAIALPFPVTLYDQTFATAMAGSNGHLTFGSDSASFNITCSPFGVAGTTYVLAPYWGDQCTGACGAILCDTCGIFTTVVGTAPNRIFYIEWRTQYYNQAETVNYEIALYESGTPPFQFIYNTITPAAAPNDSELVVGVKKDDATFTQYGCDPSGGQNPPVSSGLCLTAEAVPCGTPTPTPTSSPTPSSTPSATPTATASPTPSPSATATASPSVTPSPSATPSATPSVTPTPTITPSVTPTATPSVTPTPTATPGGCVFGFGYWKNHPQAWPVTELQLGNVTYTQEQLLDIMHEPVRGNGLVSLAHHLIAAKLNVANGADPSCIQQTIADADTLIGDLVVPPIGDGYLAPRDVNALKDTLEDYNEGHLCAPSCDNEGSPTPSPSPPREPRRPPVMPQHQRPPR